jgi:GTPase SAR1 family protein
MFHLNVLKLIKMRKENIIKPLINYDIDKILLDDENRKPNEYFNIYKLNLLVSGGSGSGKTSFIIKLLLNQIIDFDMLILIAPNETIKSGIYKNLILKFNDLFGEDKILLLFNLSKDYEGLDKFIKVDNRIIMFNGLPLFNDIFELKQELNIKKTCLIFDDFISCLNRKQWPIYYEFIHNSSRLNATLISCCQDISKIPPNIRNSYTIVILFVNYLTISNIKTLIKNTVNVILSNEQLDYLIDYIKQDEDKHEPLILIGSDAPFDKKIIYKNQYINFD